MKKLAVLLAIVFSLAALCVPAFAAGEEEAAVSEGTVNLGSFVVLYSSYNRGMGKAEIYFGNIGSDGSANVFRVWLNDAGLDKPITEYEVVSIGTAEGDAAVEQYLKDRTIAVGTSVSVEVSEFAPVYESTEGKVGYQDGVKTLTFGGQADFSPEDYAKLYDCLNNVEIYEQDRLVQFEYSFNDGKLSVNRVELEPEEYAKSESKNPKTGVSFAVLPAVIALAAVVLNKKTKSSKN